MGFNDPILGSDVPIFRIFTPYNKLKLGISSVTSKCIDEIIEISGKIVAKTNCKK